MKRVYFMSLLLAACGNNSTPTPSMPVAAQANYSNPYMGGGPNFQGGMGPMGGMGAMGGMPNMPLQPQMGPMQGVPNAGFGTMANPAMGSYMGPNMGMMPQSGYGYPPIY